MRYIIYMSLMYFFRGRIIDMLLNKVDITAICIAKCLCCNDRLTCEEISKKAHLPLPLTRRIASQLKTTNVLTSFHGRINSGYSLARTPEEISLYDIVSAVHPDFVAYYRPTEMGVDEKDSLELQQIEKCLEQASNIIVQDLSAIKLKQVVLN